MALRAIHSRSLADQVFEQIGAEIVTGRYAPGASLPAERTLSTVFKVNRHVVREALKRLEQLGIVKVSQGGGTKVLDYQRTAGLDVLAFMAEHAREGADVAPLWLSVLEMRSANAADIVRLCALRASREVRDELVRIAAEMDAKMNDEQALFALEVRFWETVMDGADNIAYRLSFNTLLKGVFAIPDMSRHWTVEEIRRSGSRMVLARAIADGDADKAEADTRAATRASAESFAKLIGKATVAPSPSPVTPTPAGAAEGGRAATGRSRK
ncbi:MAG TPA: GntR family transcriptional regulator [Polyangiaceae bacterium]|jgi:DNA-binding FadR family transcriptional regulator|nr:GntR family transcriptional regulator [Polyangiaceae bacterium]